MVRNKDKGVLGELIQGKLIKKINWLVRLGMKASEAQTELYLFPRNKTTPIEITFLERHKTNYINKCQVCEYEYYVLLRAYNGRWIKIHDTRL